MVNQKLVDYIKSSLRSGISPEQIKQGLLAVGWPSYDVDAAFKAVRQKPLKKGWILLVLIVVIIGGVLAFFIPTKENTCSKLDGDICSLKEKCNGIWLDASDSVRCCSVKCICIESWSCTEWSDCVGNIQTRICNDLNYCGTTLDKPIESRSCVALQNCSELGGFTCSSDETCSGPWINASDTKMCCKGQCEILTISDDNSLNADGFLWGTELWPDKADIAADVINNTLKTKYLKIRLSINNVAKDKKTFSNIACFPSAQDCKAAQYDFDEVAQTFKANNWSMIPMLSYGYQGIKEPFASSDIENYVNFVDWFVSRYKNDANIKYVELENCPNCAASLSISKELLLEVTNKIYDKVKSKYPDIMMGTPGFEYWVDESTSAKFEKTEMIEYFLNKENGAKFDFWAFHGYPLSEIKGQAGMGFIHLPPTKTAVYNKYAGVKGISEIRKKLDANGWQSRLIIDTEGGTIFPGVPYTEEEEKIDAAYFVQEALLKRTQKVNGKLALAGRMPMKINIRLNLPNIIGDVTSGNLNSDGSASLVIKAVGLLWDKLNEYNYSSHISGEFDSENQVWVEKFFSDDKELYIFFKPFAGKTCVFDYQTLNYNLNLDRKPSSVILTDINGDVSDITPTQTLILEAENSPKFLEVGYK